MTRNLRFASLAVFIFLSSFSGKAQIPPGYYQNCNGLYGEALRQALHDIINNANTLTYGQLWTAFYTTDSLNADTVWDIYSYDPTNSAGAAYYFQFGTNQCGNYNSEGDCYNREHSFPKSWFNDQEPMYTDLFHIYPTDGYVNGKRGNNPYGNVSNPTWTSTNGSKLGPCGNCYGYTGEAFEPINKFKGDLARGYFYMMTRYMDKVPNWTNCPICSGGNLISWEEQVLLQWSNQDTVSQKEIDRNNAIYAIQGNRNPFIDHPEWIPRIWGPSAGLSHVVPENEQVWFNQGELHFTHTAPTAKVVIYDPTGRVLYTAMSQGNPVVVPQRVHGGIFIAVCQFPDGVTTVKFTQP